MLYPSAFRLRSIQRFARGIAPRHFGFAHFDTAQCSAIRRSARDIAPRHFDIASTQCSVALTSMISVQRNKSLRSLRHRSLRHRSVQRSAARYGVSRLSKSGWVSPQKSIPKRNARRWSLNRGRAFTKMHSTNQFMCALGSFGDIVRLRTTD